MEKTDLAYIAGIIDGEGSIYIAKCPPRAEIGMKNPYYRIGVNVKNTDEKMINFLVDCLGGTKSIQHRKTNNGRIAYSWAVADKQAISTLKKLYPYLLCKKKQADIVFKLRDSFGNPYHGYGTIKNRIPSEIITLRELYYQELKKLHFVFTGKGKRMLEKASG